MSNRTSRHPWPLTERYPEIEAIARIELTETPTPVEPLPGLGRQIGYENLWIKRDDLTGREYGGNKPRKLEYYLARVLERGFKSVVTMGGIGTNHGLATAIYARRLDLRCHLILVEQPLTDHVRKNLKLFHAFGARLHFARSFPEVGWRAAWMLAPTKLRLSSRPLALIGPGGSSPLSNLGYVNAALELERQIERGEMPAPSHVFCAAGSSGTMAGLLLGFRLCGSPTRVIGVRVADKMFANRRRVADLANRTLALIRRRGVKTDVPPIDPGEVTILENYLGGCYGEVTPESRRAVELASEHGISLETTYTGKTLAALSDFVKSIPPDSGPVLFWNTFNSRDLSSLAAGVDPGDLPRAFRRFFDPPTR